MIRCVIVQHILGQTPRHFLLLAFMVSLQMSYASFSSLKLLFAEPGIILAVVEHDLFFSVSSHLFWL